MQDLAEKFDATLYENKKIFPQEIVYEEVRIGV